MIEIYSVAFKLTGLATSKIKFQVGSLFTGAGFTTAESELIVKDPKRRKIALACIYTGHIFSVVFMGLMVNVLFSLALIIGTPFATPTFVEWYFIVLYITSALLLVVLILKIPPINKKFQKILEKIAINATSHNRHTNIVTIIDMYGKHAIAEVVLNNIPVFAYETPLYKMELNKKYSINILSVKRGVRILEVTKDTMFRKGDVLVIYGLINDINDAFIKSIDKKMDSIIVDRTNEVTLINNYGLNALVEVFVDEVPAELVGVKMQDAHLKDKYGITIGILKRKEDYITVNKDTIIEKGDLLTLFGPYKSIQVLFNNEK